MTVIANTAKDSSYVCCLSQDGRLASYGGKAYHLAGMLNSGFPVLPGFVVTDDAFQEFLERNRLRAPIAELLGRVQHTDPVSLRQTSDSIRSLVTGATVPQPVFEELTGNWRERLPGRTLIVRSSAVGEDSQQASFAGQLDSVLHVDTDAALSNALLECWASYWSARSLFYQHSRNIPLTGMGVLIQEQAESAVSGVMFTVCPDTVTPGSANRMTVEFCEGLGSDLVSGKITPQRVTVARDDLTRFDLESEDSAAADRELLNPDTIASLATWGLQLEELFGGPQDVEWTVDVHGRLFLLQSRAITVSADAPTPHVASASHCSRSVLWSNANVNENFPEPICPLLYSVAATGYYHYFRNLGGAIGVSNHRLQAMEGALRQIIGVHGARMYYNLTSIHSCLRMAPDGERLTELFNDFVGADRIAETHDHPAWHRFPRSRIGRFTELCRIAVTTGWRALRLNHGVTRFEATVDAFAAKTSPDRLPDRSLMELLGDLRSFMDIRSHRWVNASLADAAAMLSYGLLKRFLNREFPEESLASLHNTLLKGLPDLASNKPVIGLWELSRLIQNDPQLVELFAQHESRQVLVQIRQGVEFEGFYDRFQRYLDECGFRCSGELMLTVPSFQETPVALLDILKTYSSLHEESPAERLKTQESQRESETQRMLVSLERRSWFRFLPLSIKAFQARRLLNWTQRSIALRERARLKQALLYSRLRRIALAIGEQLKRAGIMSDPNDVFFLTHAEIDELLAGGSMFPHHTAELIRVRKSAHERLSRLNPPDTFELPEGEYFSNESTHSEAPSRGADPHDADDSWRLEGVGACGGSVTAPAAVLQDVSEFSRLTQGDILVTRQTDPGWAPLFFLIRGLVIERGGMLSHGAILAREYGIPTVVGVSGATQRIAHGRTLNVDGDRGVVQFPRE